MLLPGACAPETLASVAVSSPLSWVLAILLNVTPVALFLECNTRAWLSTLLEILTATWPLIVNPSLPSPARREHHARPTQVTVCRHRGNLGASVGVGLKLLLLILPGGGGLAYVILATSYQPDVCLFKCKDHSFEHERKMDVLSGSS